MWRPPSVFQVPSRRGIVCACVAVGLCTTLGAPVWAIAMAALPWLLWQPRPEPEVSLEEPQDLGMEVLQAICTLPRPLGMDRAQLPAPEPEEAAGLSRTRLILDCVSEGVMVLGPRGELLLSNAAARRILGLRTIVGGDRSFLDHLNLQLKKLMAKGLSKVRNGRRDHHQIKAIQAGGKVLDLSFLRLPPSPSHPVECAVVLITDMSQVYASSRATDSFLSCISHELRTPLTHIRAAVEILSQMPPSDPVEHREFLEVIEDQAVMLTDVVDDVLEYSQLEASDEPWEMGAVDLGDVVHTLRREEERRLSQDSLQLSIDLGPSGSAAVIANEARLRQVVGRLLDNAIKFSPPGGVIRIQARPEGSGVRVDVEDSGVGVDPADREAVFEKFRQLNDVLTDKPTGMGLGLATCRRIVERMDGRIWCEESSLGGARFSFVLRAADHPALV